MRGSTADAGPTAGQIIGFGAVLLVAGAAMLIAYFVMQSSVRATLDWPKAAGVINACSVVENKSRRGGPWYNLSLSYSYAGEGRSPCTGTRLRPDGNAFTRQYEASEAAMRYRPGTSVWVYYDPKKPTEAILEPGDAPSHQVLIYAALIGGGIGAAFLGGGIWARKTRTT